MEMQSSLIMSKPQTSTMRKALIIPAKNINFFIITTLTSLPLFCFLIYYEPLLQKFMVEIPKSLNLKGGGFYDQNYLIDLTWSIHFDIAKKLNQKFPKELAQLALLYLVPLHLLELITVLVTVDLGSKIHTEEPPKMSLKEMVKKPFDKSTRLILGTYVTYSYVLALSTCALLVFTWLCIINYAFFRPGGRFNDFFREIQAFSAPLLWCPGFIALVILYLGWSAAWNVSVVISVLEGIHGIKAFCRAIYFTGGFEWRGFGLMFIFFAWEVGIRLPCLCFGYYGRENYIGIVARALLLCIVNVMKWLVCMIYFFDCKNRDLERKLLMKSKKEIKMVDDQ